MSSTTPPATFVPPTSTPMVSVTAAAPSAVRPARPGGMPVGVGMSWAHAPSPRCFRVGVVGHPRGGHHGTGGRCRYGRRPGLVDGWCGGRGEWVRRPGGDRPDIPLRRRLRIMPGAGGIAPHVVVTGRGGRLVRGRLGTHRRCSRPVPARSGRVARMVARRGSSGAAPPGRTRGAGWRRPPPGRRRRSPGARRIPDSGRATRRCPDRPGRRSIRPSRWRKHRRGRDARPGRHCDRGHRTASRPASRTRRPSSLRRRVGPRQQVATSRSASSRAEPGSVPPIVGSSTVPPDTSRRRTGASTRRLSCFNAVSMIIFSALRRNMPSMPIDRSTSSE